MNTIWIWVVAVALTVVAGLAVAVEPKPVLAPEPIPVSVTWQRVGFHDVCWGFAFKSGTDALRFADFASAIDPRGGAVVVRIGRGCPSSFDTQGELF